MKSPLQEIADNIAALTRPSVTTTAAQRYSGTGEDGIHRRTPETFTYRVEHPSLLHQLTAALQRGRAGLDDSGGVGKPASRPPSAGTASSALHTIAEEARWLHRDLQHATGRRCGRLGSLTELLEDLRALAHAAPTEQARAAAVTSSWVTTARTALALDAPVATLRDVRCPECHTPLKVRQDGSSDVWCPNPACRDTEGRRFRWARPEWGFLLERIAGEQQSVEGAA